MLGCGAALAALPKLHYLTSWKRKRKRDRFGFTRILVIFLMSVFVSSASTPQSSLTHVRWVLVLRKQTKKKKRFCIKMISAWRRSAGLFRLCRCGEIWKNCTFSDVFKNAMFYFYKRINQSATSLVREITSPVQNFIVVHDQSLGRKFSTLRLVDESPQNNRSSTHYTNSNFCGGARLKVFSEPFDLLQASSYCTRELPVCLGNRSEN